VHPRPEQRNPHHAGWGLNTPLRGKRSSRAGGQKNRNLDPLLRNQSSNFSPDRKTQVEAVEGRRGEQANKEIETNSVNLGKFVHLYDTVV